MRVRGIWFVALLAAACYLPTGASAVCSDMAFTDYNPNDIVGHVVNSSFAVAQKYVLHGQTDIAAIRLHLSKSASSTGWMEIEYRQDVNGHPGASAYHRGLEINLNCFATGDHWYEFTEFADTQDAGTYWIVMWVEAGDPAELTWLSKRWSPSNLCGDGQDAQAYVNGSWQLQGVDLNYEVVCSDCPMLYDCSISPASTTDNASRTYTYEVTYRNFAGNAPTKSQVQINDVWYDMTRIDANPYTSGTRYRYQYTARIGVGDHTANFHFERNTLSLDLTCSGPRVVGKPPTITSTSFTPNPAKNLTTQNITFSCTAADTDGSIGQYQWRLVRREDSTTRTYSYANSSFQDKASTIGIGTWDVYTTVVDDDNLKSTEYKNPTALQIIDSAWPTVNSVTPSLDGLAGNQVGVFIPGLGLTVNNTFTVTATADTGLSISKVEFKMPHRTLGTQTLWDNSSAGGWTQTFNMDDLPDGGGDLEVKAYDNATPQQHVSLVWKTTLVTTGRPSWWGKSWVYSGGTTYDSSAGRYNFDCWAPAGLPSPPSEDGTLNFKYDITPPGNLFGTLHNHFQSGIHVIEHFNYDGSPSWWDYWAAGVLKAEVLSQTLADEEFDGQVIPPSTTPSLPDYDRLRYLSAYRMLSPDFQLFDKSIDGPSFDQRGVVDFVEWHAHLGTKIGFEVSMSLGADLNPDLTIKTFRIEPTPQFSVTFDMYVEIYEGVARLGVEATPTMSLTLPLVYSLATNSLDWETPCFKFWVDCTLYGAVGCGFWGCLLRGDLYSFTYPSPPYRYPSGCGGDGMASAGDPTPPPQPPFAAPTIACDKKAPGSSSICVWVHDADADPNHVNPELYYSYFPDNRVPSQWSVPAPVFAPPAYPQGNPPFESDPKVIYTATNQAMLVWTQNTLSEGLMQTETKVHNIIKNQELWWAKWTYNPATKTGAWTLPATNLTNDGGAPHGDGLVALGADENSGKAIAVWVRELYNNQPLVTRTAELYNPTWEIYGSTWNGAWSGKFAITTDAPGVADAQPDVAMDANGNAFVVWTRDSDSNFMTNGDRYIAYRTYTAATGAWFPPLPQPPTTQPGWPSGALWPSVTYDLSNSPILLFTSRLTNTNGQPTGDGPSDRLWSACFNSAPPSVMPVGEEPGPRALEPKIRCDSQGEAIAIWRGFTGTGPFGFTGEVATNLRYSGLPTCGNWGGTEFLTYDNLVDWQIDFDVNQSNKICVVDVKKTTGNPAIEFGDGFDGIYLDEIGRGPDLLVQNITFSNNRPQAGEYVTITARIYNAGNQRAFGPFNVVFNLDGATYIGTKQVTLVMEQNYVDVQQQWESDGLIHTINVRTDPTDVVTETNETNNDSGKEIGRLPAPINLLAYTDPVSGKIVLTWAHEEGPDHYHVFRSTTSGSGYALIDEASNMVYADSTAAIDTPYFYVVKAVVTDGDESNYSNEASANLGPDTDSDLIPDIADPDDDNDGMPDVCEVANGFDPLDPSDADLDADGDGYTNREECQAGTDPHDPASHPDTVPPTTPVVTAASYSTSATQLSATWTATDDYSGIGDYNYAIGTVASGTDVQSWTSNGTSGSLTATGLTLTNGGVYYISVRATDGAGNIGGIGVSRAITVDTTVPTITGPTAKSWTPESSLTASWEASDPECGVQKCEYSVGTSAGGTTVVGWTDVGLSLGMTHAVALTNGQRVYVNVRATNMAGLQATASSGPMRAVKTPASIAGALEFADDVWVVLQQKIVTGVIGDSKWLEEANRSAALKVVSALSAGEGRKVTVVGQLKKPDYTRQIEAEDIEDVGSGDSIAPLGLTNKAVGGLPRNLLTPGVTGGIGLNNVGLLVTTWGIVSNKQTGYFYLDDGGIPDDGTGHAGLRVRTEGLDNPTGNFAIVTGLVEAARLTEGGPSIRMLIPRRQSDIR